MSWGRTVWWRMQLSKKEKSDCRVSAHVQLLLVPGRATDPLPCVIYYNKRLRTVPRYTAPPGSAATGVKEITEIRHRGTPGAWSESQDTRSNEFWCHYEIVFWPLSCDWRLLETHCNHSFMQLPLNYMFLTDHCPPKRLHRVWGNWKCHGLWEISIHEKLRVHRQKWTI